MDRTQSLLFDILYACDLILSFTKDMTYETFAEDQMCQDAVIRRIEIMGEASNKLTDGFRASHPLIAWQLLRGMRNRLVHAYNEVDIDLVWTTIQCDIPAIKAQVSQLLLPP